jgi:outer membrane protein OmpU
MKRINIMNIKKIGLTALAGSLAMVSAGAVELVVTGKTEVTYVTKDYNTTGNPFGLGNMISFNGSGDVNGMTVSYNANMQDGGSVSATTSDVFASASLMVDMGDLGKTGLDQGAGVFGADTIDDMMPYAYEEIWTYVGSGTSAGHAVGGGNQNVIGYSNSYAGLNLSVEIDPGQKASSTGDGGTTAVGTTEGGVNFALTSSDLMDGLTVGLGHGEEDTYDKTMASEATYNTGFAKYAIGAATVGYQLSESRGGSSGKVATDSEFYGISYSVNENFAISYNEVNTDFYSVATASQEETTGIGASYTMGSAAVRVLTAEIKNKGGVTTAKDETVTELSVMLAF